MSYRWDWEVFLRDTGGGETYLQWMLSAWGWTLSVAAAGWIVAVLFGVGTRNGLVVSGAWVWRWKDWIDRRFMARFSELPEMAPAASTGAAPVKLEDEEAAQAISALAMLIGLVAAMRHYLDSEGLKTDWEVVSEAPTDAQAPRRRRRRSCAGWRSGCPGRSAPSRSAHRRYERACPLRHS